MTGATVLFGSLAAWLKLNDAELTIVANWLGVSDDPTTALAAIRSHYSLELICATFGADGAMMMNGDGVIRQPRFDVSVVDTIGCGDAFLATWLDAMLSNDVAENALRRGCAAGAATAMVAGANPLQMDEAIGRILGESTA